MRRFVTSRLAIGVAAAALGSLVTFLLMRTPGTTTRPPAAEGLVATPLEPPGGAKAMRRLETDCNCAGSDAWNAEDSTCIAAKDLKCTPDRTQGNMIGCDGRVYDDRCAAYVKGIKRVEPESLPAGIAACRCPMGHSYQGGSCVPLAESTFDPDCDPIRRVFVEVCGCDGKLYPDACMATRTGVKAWSAASQCQRPTLTDPLKLP